MRHLMVTEVPNMGGRYAQKLVPVDPTPVHVGLLTVFPRRPPCTRRSNGLMTLDENLGVQAFQHTEFDLVSHLRRL